MKLEKLRVAAGLSRQDLADQIGVTRQAVWLWETGRKIPIADKAVAIAKMFDISVEELMEDKDGRKNF